MSGPLRLALCNELFERFPLPDACRRIHALGYRGLEVAPFTLAPDPARLTRQRRQEIRSVILESGLEFVGLHWLLAAPPGLHVTTSDTGLREHSWEYIRHLVDLCADLGENGVMVFGSPKQRSTVDGMNPRQATALFTEGLALIAPHAQARGVTVLVEALPTNQSNVINSLSEAVSIVRQIANPAVQTMFDSHNAVDEQEEHSSLIRRCLPYIRHVHVNETDGREPGMGDYNFSSILNALAESGYTGWISLEVFDFSRDPEQIAQRARQHLEAAQPATAIAQNL